MVQDEVAGNLLKDADEAENKENWTAVKFLRLVSFFSIYYFTNESSFIIK